MLNFHKYICDWIPKVTNRRCGFQAIGDWLAKLYRRPLVILKRLIPKYDPHQPLCKGVLVKIPDPGFIPLLTARLAAEVLVAPGLNNFSRTASIKSLVPLTNSDPTTMDTVLARILLAAQPSDTMILDSLKIAVTGYAPEKQ